MNKTIWRCPECNAPLKVEDYDRPGESRYRYYYCRSCGLVATRSLDSETPPARHSGQTCDR